MKNILYTKNFNQQINEDVNVILSPHFYWIKKIEIPIKYKFEAKKIANHIFELDPQRYFFEAIKLNNQFYAIAIEKNLQLNIDKKYIKSLRIAQCEFQNIECINLDNNFSLKRVDDILFCFPNQDKNCKLLSDILPDLNLSKIEFHFFHRLNIDKTTTIFIILSMIFLFLSFFIRGIDYKTNLKQIQNRFNSLSTYNLPLSNYQLDSIINSLSKKDLAQQKIKKALINIQNISLKKDEKILNLKFSKDKFILKINSNRNLDNLFNKNFNIINSTHNNNNIYKVTLNAK